MGSGLFLNAAVLSVLTRLLRFFTEGAKLIITLLITIGIWTLLTGGLILFFTQTAAPLVPEMPAMVRDAMCLVLPSNTVPCVAAIIGSKLIGLLYQLALYHSFTLAQAVAKLNNSIFTKLFGLFNK